MIPWRRFIEEVQSVDADVGQIPLAYKVSCEGLLGGGLSILKHLHLNDYAEFDSKISYIMFLHDYLLACEIYTV